MGDTRDSHIYTVSNLTYVSLLKTPAVSKVHHTDSDYQEAASGTLRVNVLEQHWSQVGCDYRAGLQRDTWAGSWAGGCVVGELRQDAQRQAPRAAADPSVCGSGSGLNNIYKPPHEDRSALLLVLTICLTL